MTLTFVTDDQVRAANAHISVILHGPEKIGKSTAAASAPGPILWLNADAPSALRYARRAHPDTDIREVRIAPRVNPDAPATATATLREAVLYLQEGNGIQTVVLDPLGRIYDLILDDIAGGGRPSLPNHQDAQSYIERMVLALLELPVHVVLVAHDHPYQMGTTEDGSEVRELLPFCGSASNPALAKKLMRPVDVIAYCGVKVDDAEDGTERRTFVAQLFQGGGRRAGDRLGVLGDSRPLDLSEWIAANDAALSTNDDDSTPETGEEDK